MEIQVSEHSGCRRIALIGSLTIASAEQTRMALIAAIDGHRECDIDVSAVDAIDTAGLQLLLMVRRAAEKVRFMQPSEVIRQMLSLANLGAEIADVEG